MTRTTRIPRLLVAVDGRSLDSAEVNAVEAVTVAQRLNLPDQLELAFRGGAPKDVEPGAPLRVEVEGAAVALFSGEVTALEHVLRPDGTRSVRVRAYDRLHRLRLAQDVTVHRGVTIGSLARDRAGVAGLSVQVETDGPELARVVQMGQSDLELLHELSARSGVVFHLRQDTLHLFDLDGVGEPVPMRWGDNLREARLDVNALAGDRAVRVEGWDPLGVASFSVEESGNGRHPGPADLGATGPVRLAGAVAASEAEAQGIARARLHRRSVTARALWAVADGDPRLRPGAVADLSGVDGGLDGRYTLGAVTHRIDDAGGFSSELSSPPPPEPSGRTSGVELQLATVSRVDDPEGLGRVTVTLDAVGEVETEWLHVLSCGAGPDKGLVMLPDVNDHVLVLAPPGDAGRGVVLGGLYGTEGAPDPGVVEGAVRRSIWRTAGGQLVRLDDEHRTVRVEDATGSFVELSPERVVVHAAVDLALEAPGKAVTITGRSVDFLEG